MKKRISLVILLMLLLSFNIFAGEIEYDYSSSGDEISIMDIELESDNTWKHYSSVNYPLPYYVPQGAWHKLVDDGKSTTTVGIHTPRFFDDEKYTDFRVDIFDLPQLTETESKLMDELQVTVHHENNTAGQCEINIFVSTTKIVGSSDYSYSSENNHQIYSIPIAYDLRYLNMPTMKGLMQDNCGYIFSDYQLSEDYYAYWDDDESQFRRHGLITNLCTDDDLFFLQAGAYVYFKSLYNASSSNEASVLLYDDATSVKNVDGTCSKNGFTAYCYPLESMQNVYDNLDNWVYNTMYGTGYTEFDCINDFPTDDVNYKECKNVLSNNPFGLSYKLDIFNPNVRYSDKIDNCRDYIDDVHDNICNDVYTADEVQDMMWDDLKDAFDIQKGSNLFPLNIARLRYKCSDTETRWDKDVFFDPNGFYNNKLKPYAESTTKYCDYSELQSEDINATLEIVFQGNPLFNTVAGATSISQTQEYEWFEAFNTLGWQTNATIEAGRNKFVWQLEHTVDKGLDDGCMVYITTDQVNRTSINLINNVIDPLNDDVEQVSQELRNLVNAELQFYQSEKEQSTFILLILNIAKLMNRIHVLIYYIISAVMFFAVFALVMGIPFKIVRALRKLYNTHYSTEDKEVF